ncbi:MAG TPA: transcriptional regulator [Streptosporangiaceae bacterium]|nr:transcriptional regulator [Streptosporangiaceae bacterium]
MRHEAKTQDYESGIAAVGALEDEVRRELYVYVARRGQPVGRDEAATAVGIGRPLAAYHLDKLVDLGLLSATYARPPGRRGPGAGRPAKVYARSGREFTVSVPQREYELAAKLLAQAVAADESKVARAALDRASRQLGADLGRCSRAPGAHLDDHRRRLTAALAQHGFEPWQDEQGTVNLGSCPFHQLAAQYPKIVCGMNLALIDGLIDGLGAAGLRPSLDPQPGRCCVVVRSQLPEVNELPEMNEPGHPTTGAS